MNFNTLLLYNNHYIVAKALKSWITMCSNMGKYVAIISDLDGKASVLRRLKSSIPHGSTVIYDGDICLGGGVVV